MATHPTSKRRRQKQQLKERYAKVREDAQLADLIPTTPEGAVRNEVAITGNAQLPELVRQAIRESWSTPDAAKGAIVANLLEPFFAERQLDAQGRPVPPDRKELIELAKTLRLLDQTQYERDNPEAAGVAKGATNISLQNTLQATEVMREALGDVDEIMKLTKQCFQEPELSQHQIAAQTVLSEGGEG